MRILILFSCLAFAVAQEEEFHITKRAYFDITVRGRVWGRIEIGLYGDDVPITVNNFMELCKRPEGSGYKGSRIHKILKDNIIQGGDYENGDGSGGQSVYGPTFEDESFHVHHLTPGTISMANKGPHTNGAQFFITLAPLGHLDNKHVAFGRV